VRGDVPSKAEVLEEIARILSEVLGLARPPAPSLDLSRDLALDSLAQLTLAVALEDRFRVRLREEDAGEVRTLGDLAGLVVRRAKEQSS
jgi:acyl carrier protein